MSHAREKLAEIAKEKALLPFHGNVGGDSNIYPIIRLFPNWSVEAADKLWCAAFVYYCCIEAGFDIPLRPKECTECNLAGCLSWEEYALGDNAIRYFKENSGTEPMPGDIVIYDNVYCGTEHDHIGIVLEAHDDHIIAAEGNAGNTNTSSVESRDRDEHIRAYIRLPEQLLITEKIADLYGVSPDELTAYPSHEGGRNKVYRAGDIVIRVSRCSDRAYGDYLAEAEYVRYLADNGADAVNAVPSVNGRLVEQLESCVAAAFTVAKGDQIAEHGYQYREGAPLSEYFFNCGSTLGKIHALSKKYEPITRRFDFFEKYNEEYLDSLIPDEYAELKKALSKLLQKIESLPRNADNYGMVHFDYSDGNYNIDYNTGKITVFDFENCRTCFYLFDLANLWTHGVGWIVHESDAEKRRAFMDSYFAEVLAGYRSETDISDGELENLKLMIRAVLMENIIDEFEVQKTETGAFEMDEEQAYRIECMVHGMDYMGFFDEIYDNESPFEIEI